MFNGIKAARRRFIAMTLSMPRVQHYLKNFKLEKLFIEELGWDRHSQAIDIPIDQETFTLTAVAQKRGVGIFLCLPDSRGNAPAYAIRRKIESRLAKQAYEHLIIFTDSDYSVQIWQWVARGHGRPAACREHKYYPGRQSGESLIQKLDAITFSISDEEDLTLTGTTLALKDAFDRDVVTKRFYDCFKNEHKTFLGFIKGIKDRSDQAWYASLMLNRLMFVYFIQKKGFLDKDRDYLRNRLAAVQARKGKGKFLTFYRYFLLTLFHQGFATQPPYRKLDSDLKALIGNVPYLDGGLFDLHELEIKHPETDIPDEAFEKVFQFFDQYEWHLDNRPLANDREINPDVLGYIFEKYINQKEMGAYYTKEDITEYIGKNTIIPYLFDAAQKRCKVAFEKDAAMWNMLRDDPDRYIYPAVRKGVIDSRGEVIPLPDKIRAGIDDVSKRTNWNQPADPEYALPTETWREHVARRNRCLEIREKLEDGQIYKINDLITYNLDIRQFAQDVILSCEGPELLRAFYRTLVGHIPKKSNEKHESGISVLDPTCGSGAFLFAALNILEPIYEACLDRMQEFVDDLEHSEEKPSPRRYEDFKSILNDIARHPNRSYYIYKTIVVNNLYGVDIMTEAVEICKLRLFLKLVSQVDRAKDLEPLPDIDFNIRSGNTLVGFVTREEVRRAAEWKASGKHQQAQILLDETETGISRVEEQAEIVERAFREFRQMQTVFGMDAKEFAAQKQELRQRLKNLTDELNQHLANEYGVDPKKPKKYKEWLDSHQPFHWFAEFYGIMANGGFDVIIGNPPWKEYSTVRKIYKIKKYATESCGNLYGICTERSILLRSVNGRLSFIVQLPLVCSSRMDSVRAILIKKSCFLHIIHFDDRPGKLFNALQHCRAAIYLSEEGNPNCNLMVTRYQRWPTLLRPILFSQLEFAQTAGAVLKPGLFPKYASDIQTSVFNKIKKHSDLTISHIALNRLTEFYLFYQEAMQYWAKATIGLPFYSKNGVVGAPAHGRYVYFEDHVSTAIIFAILNSSTFYSYFIAYGDCFHLTSSLVNSYTISKKILEDKNLYDLSVKLQSSLIENSNQKTIQTKDGSEICYAEFKTLKSKPIIDKIDFILSDYYKFGDDELDFIINYDYKYRTGVNN